MAIKILGARISLIIGFMLALYLFEATLINAQVQDIRWSAPYRLSTEGARVEMNYAVADEYGYVHVFWREEGLPDGRMIIQYARFDGENWSSAVDIHAAPVGTPIEDVFPMVDKQGILHLIWTEGGSNVDKERPIYYMQAPAYDALSARYWSKPIRIDVPANLIRLQVDSKGVYHILYSKYREPQPGVYYIRSMDQGATWSDPEWLDPDIPTDDNTPARLEFVLDDNDGLHTVWHYSPFGDALTGGNWVRYTHSLDGGDTWSSPFTIDKDSEGTGRLSVPGPLIATSGSYVHIVWAGGELAYRNHRFSSDYGRTWSQTTTRIFGELNGQAADWLLADGAGRIHFLGQIRYPQGVYHAYWDQGHWTPPSLVYLIQRSSSEQRGDRIHAHGLRSAFRSGNQLVITFHPPISDEDGSLYTMYRTLDDIPALPPEPAPTSVLISTPTPEQIHSTPTAIVLVPTPPASAFDPNLPYPAPDDLSKPGTIFWLALIPTSLLIGTVTVIQLLKKR